MTSEAKTQLFGGCWYSVEIAKMHGAQRHQGRGVLAGPWEISETATIELGLVC